MNGAGCIHRFNIFAQSADRCESASRHCLDEKTKNRALAARGFGCIWGCLCRYDVLAGTIIPLYLPGEISILGRHAMDRIRFQKLAILFAKFGFFLHDQLRSSRGDTGNSLFAAKLW